MKKIQQEQFDQAIGKVIQQELRPGYRCEPVSTSENMPYTLQVCFVDLRNVIPGARHLYSESDTLIKYTEAKYSPVSADYLKLATPSYYRELKTESNSELIADDLESAYRERLDWKRQGSPAMENLKNRIGNIPGARGSMRVQWIRGRKDFYLYCTSIAPYLSHKREKQMKSLSTDYDAKTKIENPSDFAKQLGRDVGQHINIHNNFKRDYRQRAILSILRFFGKLPGYNGEYLISVEHGPVVYLNENKIGEIVKRMSDEEQAGIIPFIKREKYKEQQEYRFLVHICGYILDETELYLKISSNLRNLVSRV